SQPLARRTVSGLQRGPARPQGRARPAVLRRAGPAGLSARRRTPGRRAPRRRYHLPRRSRAVPHAAGGLQPAERRRVLPERVDSREDTAESVGAAPIHSSKNLVGTVVAASTSCSADLTNRTTIGN